MSSLSFHWRPFAEAEPNADGQVKIAGNFEIFLKAIVKVERKDIRNSLNF